MRYAWLIALAVVATTGCNQAELKKALSEAKAAEAQKDSLLTEVLETTQFVSDVNSELAKAKTVATKPASTDPGVPGAKKDREERVAALERVIRAQIDRGVFISAHLREGAVDIRNRDMTQAEKRAFLDGVDEVGGVLALEESRPPHYHLQID